MTPEHGTPGKRTLATVLDQLAKHCPAKLVCRAPNGPRVADGFWSLNIEDLSKAVDATAWLIRESFGVSDKSEILLYLGDDDVRYLVFIVACQKTGYKPLLPSTKNSLNVNYALLEQTGCSGVLFSATFQEQAEQIRDSPMASRLMELPSFDNIVASFSRSYSYDKTYQAIEDDSAVIIHSSGTTGVPKPIYLTHGFLGTIDKQTQVPVPDGRVSAIPNQLSHDDLFLSTTPFFHLMGIFALVMSIFNRVPFVYLPATSSPADALVEVIKAERPTVAAITPALVEAVGQSASALHILSTVRTVCISGAPLAPHIGQALSKTTNLVSILGASKLGLVLSLVPEHKADWEYLEWNPNYPTRMDSCSDNSSLYELVIERNETRDIQGIFHVFPDLKEYRTKDLFSPHPTRHNLWRYEGRLDDTIIFHNGQKINPIPMEKIIESHPLVSRALVIGDRRPHAALLVEPSEESSVSNGDKSAVTEFVHTIWPVVELANELVPPGVHIGIMRIGLSSPNKPFRTTSEGSTQRRTVLQDYEQEIERIYQHDNYWYTMFKNG